MIRAVTKIMRVSRRTFHCFDDFSKWQRVSLTSRLRLRPTFGLFLLFLLMSVAQSSRSQPFALSTALSQRRCRRSRSPSLMRGS